jgi:putative pyoverdin transport system ATP-binding/permease protein
MLDSGLSITIIFVCTALSLVTMYNIFIILRQIFKKERKFDSKGFGGIITLVVSFILIGGLAFCIYNIPNILYDGFSWAMFDEMGPSALLNVAIGLAFVIPIFYLYFILSYFFEKHDEKPFFMIIVLSITSGLGNSLIIFVINVALNRNLDAQSRNLDPLSRIAAIQSGLYIYVIIGIILFTVSAMIVRKKLISITNNVVYSKRMEIIGKILKAPFFKFEAIDTGKTQAALNNDTEAVSGFVNMFVNGITGLVTMITCFVYLGTLSMYGMIFSVLIIFFAAGLFILVSKSAEKLFEKNRDVQNVFFKNINDLVNGFKELYINKKKRYGFRRDIQKSCEDYRETRVAAEYRFVGVSILGEIMYLSVIALVVFTFPLIFQSIRASTLRTYVLVYLYMGGIVNAEIFIIPGLVRTLVSWKRINWFLKEVSLIQDKAPNEDEDDTKYDNNIEIQLRGVKFQYKNENGEKFSVGPIDYDFKSGEIVFISGGNGSGKTTLAKLITGLYQPDEGEITLNGEKLESKSLGGYFSAVYSDFFLFDKLYGIDYAEKQDKIQEYLEILHLGDKVQIKDGVFSTLKLSTGQRKRLALLESHLEDRPAYFFDEWAADQDPEYRKFFYTVLLPELKQRGKAVIAITHDDRYFNEADKLIKMEFGKIIGS